MRAESGIIRRILAQGGLALALTLASGLGAAPARADSPVVILSKDDPGHLIRYSRLEGTALMSFEYCALDPATKQASSCERIGDRDAYALEELARTRSALRRSTAKAGGKVALVYGLPVALGIGSVVGAGATSLATGFGARALGGLIARSSLVARVPGVGQWIVRSAGVVATDSALPLFSAATSMASVGLEQLSKLPGNLLTRIAEDLAKPVRLHRQANTLSAAKLGASGTLEVRGSLDAYRSRLEAALRGPDASPEASAVATTDGSAKAEAVTEAPSVSRSQKLKAMATVAAQGAGRVARDSVYMLGVGFAAQGVGLAISGAKVIGRIPRVGGWIQRSAATVAKDSPYPMYPALLKASNGTKDEIIGFKQRVRSRLAGKSGSKPAPRPKRRCTGAEGGRATVSRARAQSEPLRRSDPGSARTERCWPRTAPTRCTTCSRPSSCRRTIR
jgi:hypothetical protein